MSHKGVRKSVMDAKTITIVGKKENWRFSVFSFFFSVIWCYFKVRIFLNININNYILCYLFSNTILKIHIISNLNWFLSIFFGIIKVFIFLWSHFKFHTQYLSWDMRYSDIQLFRSVVKVQVPRPDSPTRGPHARGANPGGFL